MEEKNESHMQGNKYLSFIKKRNNFNFKKDIISILNRHNSYKNNNIKDYCINNRKMNLKNNINNDEIKTSSFSSGINQLYKNNSFNKIKPYNLTILNKNKNNANTFIQNYSNKNNNNNYILNNLKYSYSNKNFSEKGFKKIQYNSFSERGNENNYVYLLKPLEVNQDKFIKNNSFLVKSNEKSSNKTNINFHSNLFNKEKYYINSNQKGKIKLFNDYLETKYRNKKNDLKFLLEQKEKKMTYKKLKIKKNNRIIIDSNNENNKNMIKAYGVVSKPGKDEKNIIKINQDNYIVSTNIFNKRNLSIFGVLDGHGINGHFVSNYVGKYILNNFNNNKEISTCQSYEEIYYKLKENNYKIIKDLFINAEKELHKENFDCNFSGTTAIIIFEIGKYLISANVGDSRAILIYSNINNSLIETIKNNFEKHTNRMYNLNYNTYQIKNIIKPYSNKKSKLSFSFEKDRINQLKSLTKIFNLSRDLKPDIPSEKKRIKKYGGIIGKYIDKKGDKNGPFRVWVKSQNYPGLAMSRSIGDFVASSIGVIPEPEITEYKLNKNSKYMVICSDGIWDFISNEKVMDIGNRFYPKNTPEEFCNELVKQATYFWEKNDIVIDDITALVVYF